MREQGVGQPADLRTMPEESDLAATIHRLKAELRQKDEEQLAISQVHRAISAHLEYDELLAAIAAAACSVLRFSWMGVVLPAVDEQDLLVYFVDLKQGQAMCQPPRAFPAAGTVSAWVFENQESFLAQHIEDLRPFPYCYEDCRKAGIQSHCALPLIMRGRTAGVLIFAGAERNLYPPSLLPFLRQFATAVAIAVDNHQASEGRARLKSQLALSNGRHTVAAVTEDAFGSFVGQSPAIRVVMRKISMVAGTDSSVLISGETGTGKGLVARALHQQSNRRHAPLITVNCASLPVGIIESELFGHEKGAFTGAVVRRAGRFELADRGTIFLDEIGDLPLEVQAKLLRVLQDQEFERVGGTRTLKVDVRVIAATNRFLPKAQSNNGFRSDLFYRLNVFPVHVPPLRERRVDILPLAAYLLKKYATRLQKPVHVIDHQTMRRLVAYSWPGNVRELENIIERGVIVSDGPVLDLDDDLPAAIKTGRELYPQVGAGQPETTRPHDEAQHLLKSLELSGGNHSRAARSLGIGRTTLWRKLKLHGLTGFLVAALGEDVLLPIWSILSVF